MSPFGKFEVLPPPSKPEKRFGIDFSYEDVEDSYIVYNQYVDALNIIMIYTANSARKHCSVPPYFQKFDYDYLFKALQKKTTAPEAIKNYEKYFSKLTYNIAIINYYFLYNSLTALQQMHKEYHALIKRKKLTKDAMICLEPVGSYISNTMTTLGIKSSMNFSNMEIFELAKLLQAKEKNINVKYMSYYIQLLGKAKDCIEHDRLFSKKFTQTSHKQRQSDIESDKIIELEQNNIELSKRLSELEHENTTLKAENKRLIDEAAVPTIQKLINKIKSRIR